MDELRHPPAHGLIKVDGQIGEMIEISATVTFTRSFTFQRKRRRQRPETDGLLFFWALIIRVVWKKYASFSGKEVAESRLVILLIVGLVAPFSAS